jgi:pSer/pThr/pTyr-binding forkhead associated (FHA) protein
MHDWSRLVKRYYLLFEKGSCQKTIYPLLEATTFGRDTSNSIQLEEPTASRNHARIRYWQGSWIVEDLGSINGIIISGERVEKATIQPGDSFKIGETTFSLVEREIAESKDPLRTTIMALSATIQGLESPVIGDGKDSWSGRFMDVISVIPFFVPLQKTERKQLAETAKMHVFKAGEMIIREGDPGRSIYVILDGQLRVSAKDHDGNESELETLSIGQFFGVTSLLSGKPRSSTVAALESTALVELSSASMAKVIKQNQAAKNVLVQYYKSRRRGS